MYSEIQWTTFCSHCHSRVVEMACGSFAWIDCLGCGKRILFDYETHCKQGAKTEMTDEEFLRYCETHCETQRAGFVKDNLDRLFVLMGEEPNPHLREGAIYPCDPSVMLPWVKRARRWQKWMALLQAIEGNELDLLPGLKEPVRVVREMLSVPA